MKGIWIVVSAICALVSVNGSVAGQSTPRDSIMEQCTALDTSTAWQRVARAWAADTGSRARRNETLRQELLAMRAADQQLRSSAAMRDSMTSMSFIHRMSNEDSLRAERLKKIVDQYGWPGKSLVGPDGATGAFLIVQHNGFLMRPMLALMRAQPAGEVNPADLAMLEDRINTQDGKPQRFGSQLKPPTATEMEFFPIEDLPGIEARRAAAGLVPFAVYSCVMGRSYGRTIKVPR
jgi:hypothetical protein